MNLSPNITLIEGMSRTRIKNLREELPKARDGQQRILMPYLKNLGNDRELKNSLFGEGEQRDSVAEYMCSLANRRATFIAGVHADKAAPDSIRSLVLNIHLLSSYSALRESSSLDRWADMVALTFLDLMPKRIVFLDHRADNGKLDTTHRTWSYRDENSVGRDNDRRVEALKALHCRIPDLEVITLHAGIPLNIEAEKIYDFATQGL